MNKINLESDLLTDERKVGVVTYFIASEIISVALWAYDWSILGLLCHLLAIIFATNIYKAEIFYNTKNGNKEFIKKWLCFFFSVTVMASVILLFLNSPYSALFVFSTIYWQSLEIMKYESYDKSYNKNSPETSILEKHFHIKNLLIPLAFILLGMMIYGIVK